MNESLQLQNLMNEQALARNQVKTPESNTSKFDFTPNQREEF